jgi:hypothetical protein
LFIGPFYKLNEQESDGVARFRKAYCEARHIADTESFSHVFNTAVTSQPQSAGGVYFTREEFPDGEAFNWHIENVSEVFSRALGVASATGFCALGTQVDLDAISSFTEKNNVTNFVKDPRSFKQRQFKQERYFSLDFFLTLNDATDLPFFEKAWGETRDLAATFPGILAFAMGVHKASDGTITVECQETFADADAYQQWLPKAAKHADALFSVATLATHPNPFAMVGTSAELDKVKEHCDELGCLQYAFDDCTNAKTCEDYFGDVSGVVTVVDPTMGVAGKTDGSGEYCDANNVARPCSFIHYAGLETECVNPGPPDATHRYHKVTYSDKCRPVLEGMNLTYQVDVNNVFDSQGVLKQCADYVLRIDVSCWAPPAEDPQSAACDVESAGTLLLV